MKTLTIALVSILGFLGGCGASPDGADDGAFDESIAEEDAALTTAPFTLKNYQTGLCLGVKGGSPTPGTQLIVWHCDGSTNQSWTRGYADKYGYVPLANGVAPNRCLATANSSNGSPAKIEACSSLGTWMPIYAGTDLWGKECYRFSKRGTQTKVFGVSGGSTSVGAAVILWDDFADPFGHPDQLWCVH
jgi:hypothetical protein